MEALSTKQILNILEGAKTEAKQRYKAEIRGIFGSFVTGTSTAESDIDVLVEFEETANLIDFVGLSLFLETKLERPIDVVPESAIRKELAPTILKQTAFL